MRYCFTEQAAGLVHLDARWYNPQTTRFIQPDLWNFASTGLPKEIQHEVMKLSGLNAKLLLQFPSQQNSKTYSSNNPVTVNDLSGFCPTCPAIVAYVVEQTPGAAISATATFTVEYAESGDLTEAAKKGITAAALSYATAGTSLSSVAAKTYIGNLAANKVVDGTSPFSSESQARALSATLGAIVAYPVTGFIIGAAPTLSQLAIAESVSSSASYLSYETYSILNSQSANSYCAAP
ncbi:MAG: hypothetical protein OEY29_15605 [Gammaproteobacteria bacterium]|nr:hypothetical protein [Gammaproteobacteria bacterium]